MRRPPARVRIAQRAKPSASPKPPPTRLAKIATATSRLAARDRIGQRAELRGGVAEVAVAEDEDRSAVRIAPDRCRLRRSRAVARSASRAARVTAAPLPIAAALRTTRAPARGGDRAGGVVRAVVGDPDRRAGKRAGERRERRGDALGLVVGGDDDRLGAARDRSAARSIVLVLSLWPDGERPGRRDVWRIR